VFAMNPTELRARARRAEIPEPEPGNGAMATIRVRLAYRTPLTPDNLYGHLVATAVPGVEEWRDGAYRRTLRLPHGPGVATLRPAPAGYVDCRLALTDLRDLSIAISRCRRTLDLDADPVAVDEALRADPVLRPLVAKGPGRRVPRTTDGPEFAIRAVLGQQVSTAAARTHASRLVQSYGEPVRDPGGGLTHLFPDPAVLAAMDPAELAFPRSRRTTLLRLAEALASGEVDLSAGSDWAESRARLAALPGIGPWTVEMVAMRALGDPDAFPATDLGVRYAARDLGLPDDAKALAGRSEPWRPWRAYAVQYLWATGDHAINRMPR
jgi:AraC family transcriptional regulator, regulatory protein of adaptative response / DNA-3-methyladenine glycosylase II